MKRRHFGLVWVLCLMVAILLVAVLTGQKPAQAGGDGRVDKFHDGLRVGSLGSQLQLLSVGQVDVNNGATTASATVASATPGDFAIVTPNESLGSATKFYATVTTNSLNVGVDQDPGTTVTFNFALVARK